MILRTCSGSCRSPRLVESVTSQKSAVTVLRTSIAIGRSASSGAPQARQNRARTGFSSAQRAQTGIGGVYGRFMQTLLRGRVPFPRPRRSRPGDGRPARSAAGAAPPVIKAIAVAVAAGTLALAGASGKSPRLGGCPVFPPDNPWNQRVDRLPVAGNSAAIIESIGADTGLHPDFGSGLWDGAPIGIPI